MKTPSPLPLAGSSAALQPLRTRAERQLLVTDALPPDATPAEVQRLVQELQVHQLELQLQFEELQLAQAEAERSRQQYVDLYDFAPVGYCTVAADGTLSQLNLRTSQLLGPARPQLLGRRLALFVAPAERQQFAGFLARLWAAPGQRQSCELAMHGPGEAPFFAQLEGVAAPEGPDESQPPTSCRLVLLDVTARRQGEQLLRESEGRLQLALAAAGAGVWGWELATNALYQDERAREVFGLPALPAEAAFTALHAAIHPADVASVEQALAQARRARTVFDLEHRLVHPDGSVRHAAAMGRFSYDERSGAALRLTGLVRDVTARRQVQEALDYKTRLLGNILHNLPVLLARLGPDGRYRQHTGQALRRLGLAENELVGRLAVEVFPDSAAHFARLLGGQPASYVTTTEHAGQKVYLQASGFFDEEQQEVVIFAIDITESEQLKEEATRQRLRQQKEVLSAILTTQEEERRRIAEALHNGLGQLLYGTRLHLDALPPSEAVRASQQLLNEAIEATRTISFELTPTILEDFGLVVALQELVSRIPARLAVDLNLRGLAEPLPALLATAVYRIVQELLNNVMKHAKAREVFVQVSREAGWLHLSVEDDGVGFDAGQPSRPGGIGLAGIRTRVELLGGTLTLHARPGRGTGVFLEVPVPAP